MTQLLKMAAEPIRRRLCSRIVCDAEMFVVSATATTGTDSSCSSAVSIAIIPSAPRTH